MTATRPGFLARLPEAWTLIIGFAVIILAGTVLLQLPLASARPAHLTWDEALFTATSATTVTGLTVVSTGADLSVFGQLVVLALMQVGGVGFITFSVLLFRLIGRRVTLQERLFAQHAVGATHLSGIVPLVTYVLGVTITLEAIGAAVLFSRWVGELPPGPALYYAVFHAVSAYCNAGFDLYQGTAAGLWFGFSTDPATLVTLTTLILLGGLGLPVLYDLSGYRRTRSITLYTRLMIVMTLVLTGVGFVVLMLDDGLWHVATDSMDPVRRVLTALFTTVSMRTAGLAVVPADATSPNVQILTVVWMFIGAAPASMAGGVSMSTVAVILAAVVAHSRGNLDLVAFGRTLPPETLYKAVSVMTVSTLLVAAATVALASSATSTIFPVVFEVVSAFSNTGLSLGHTADLDLAGRLLVVVIMFLGRLGPLTFVVALAQRSRPSVVKYPEEPVIMG